MSEYESFMRRALDLAARGRGRVEPNPMVGAVIVRGGRVVAEGWHARFGGPHAEVSALAACPDATGATVVVTLEPCCHFGKTPPCTQALIRAGVARVVAAVRDPFPAVAGKGFEELRRAGVEVIEGVLADEAQRLNAPFWKLRTQGLPYLIAKWAMTLDGRIATATGDSRWISGESSRRWVHDLRGRVDAIIVGLGTVLRDDPALTCRTTPLRIATRVVLDALAEVPLTSQLVRTARETPLIVAVTPEAPPARVQALRERGAEVLELRIADCGLRIEEKRNPQIAQIRTDEEQKNELDSESVKSAKSVDGPVRQSAIRNPQSVIVSLPSLLRALARREMTNVLLEGGSRALGAAFDAGLVDEAAVFVAPKIIGAAGAVAPLAGRGVERIAEAFRLTDITVERLDDDILIRGRVSKPLKERTE